MRAARVQEMPPPCSALVGEARVDGRVHTLSCDGLRSWTHSGAALHSCPGSLYREHVTVGLKGLSEWSEGSRSSCARRGEEYGLPLGGLGFLSLGLLRLVHLFQLSQRALRSILRHEKALPWKTLQGGPFRCSRRPSGPPGSVYALAFRSDWSRVKSTALMSSLGSSDSSSRSL